MELHSGVLQMLTLPHHRHHHKAPDQHYPHGPSSSFLTRLLPSFCPVFQLQTRPASEENPECDITGEPPHHAPLSPRPHVPRHDPAHRYGLVCISLSLLLRLWFTLSRSLPHTQAHACTCTLSLPTSGLPAACPRNGNQSKVTHASNHQTPAAHSFTKNRSSAVPPPPLPPSPETKRRRIDWSGDLFSQIIPVDVAFCLECILISAIKSTPLVYVHRQWWC